MRLAADQFEALLHRHDAFDGLGEPADQILERLVRQFVAYGPDHGPGHAMHDVRPVAEPFYLLDHSGLVFSADIRFKDNNHGLVCGSAPWLK